MNDPASDLMGLTKIAVKSAADKCGRARVFTAYQYTLR
jgi:hypothetical protein